MTALKIADLQRDAYTEGREEGISLGMERGLVAGREEGSYQTKLETARAMISIGLPKEQVQLCTGLSLETIRDLVQLGQ